ncbi:hypothetical protein [Streptomyces yaizuensis]|uniref:ImmA/IrrE family metallo-endopeptidase n=1 Tax=Streptomyces yaizuensis TaxID=2989713 RepID=A0ABQ5P1D9_9ACTN|nr:hypothetical protein [Streptomyces sp. YSPA8]GLF96416.1 ImmA/IrrE family metallo-endopeptidase [Streptomyces sp. YSPA8]
MRSLALWWMRWRWARRIRTELSLPEAPSLQEAVDAVAARRGRPIRLVVEPLELRVSGYCAQSDTTDYIFVDAHAGPLLQYQVVCHELIHLHRGHRPADHDTIDDDVAEALFSTVSPDIVRLVLGRDAYDEEAELEAEVIGTVLLQCLDLSRRTNTALSASFELGSTGV